MPDDSVEDETRCDDPELGRPRGEGRLELRRLEQSRGNDDGLTRDAHHVAGYRADVDGDPQLEPGGPAVGAVVPVERGRQLPVQQGYDICRGDVRRDHREQPVTAILRPGAGYALQDQAGNAEQRPPDDKTIRIVTFS
ncbi:MAG TPA: hypothetical protein VFW50_33460 [Streptosporangiaceae bacterium]|nr:hypothetical protein [Streptosporangiaceae bacterium]